MDPQRIPLAVVRGGGEVSDMTPAAMASSCVYCGGRTLEKSAGMAYCCAQAELEHLRELRAEIDRRLAVELEDPPLDADVARLLGWLWDLTRRARSA